MKHKQTVPNQSFYVLVARNACTAMDHHLMQSNQESCRTPQNIFIDLCVAPHCVDFETILSTHMSICSLRPNTPSIAYGQMLQVSTLFIPMEKARTCIIRF